MYVQDAVSHFGTKVAIAHVLGLKKAAISAWGDESAGAVVPLHNALLLERASKGALTVNFRLYRQQPSAEATGKQGRRR